MVEDFAEPVLSAFQKWFDRHPADGDPKGDRLFIRLIDKSPETRGWTDWTLVALVDKKGNVDVLDEGLQTCDTDLFQLIEDEMRKGRTGGRMSDDECVVWWCREKFDGPPGNRLSDMWKVSLPGRKDFLKGFRG